MDLNIKNIDIEQIWKEELGNFYQKRKNGLVLKDEQIAILEKYHIFYQNYSTLSSLLFEIELCLNEIEAEDLEKVSEQLSELHYYKETNK